MVSTDLNGSKVPSTPSSKESRRRTWFGLVTPKRRERASVVPQATVVETASPSLDGNSMDSVEELDATPIRPSPGDAFVSRQRPAIDDESEDDSDREGTVRRKSSKSSKQRPQLLIDSDNEHDPRPGRMKDMATLAILSRNNTVKPKPFPARVFDRSASDSSGPALPAPRPNTLVLTPSRVPQRSSSVTTNPSPVGERGDGSPLNKPLPLPPSEGEHSILSNGAPRAVSLPVTPAPPTDIVVTPSSPLDPFDSLFGLGPGPSVALPSPFDSSFSSRPNSTTPGSAPVSRIPSLHAPPRPPRPESPTPTRTSSVGLGLPASVAAKRASSSQDQSFIRPQAVSSPLPDRSASPVVKVTFSAAETTKPQDRKLSAKNRPRSLSSMFSRAPETEATPTADDAGGSSGMFGWLGVNKATGTIKRRRSESKLRKRRSGFFSSEKDPRQSETSTDDQSFSERPPLRTRLSANASTPMLINRSLPDAAATTKPAQSSHSAGSSLSSLPVIDQNEFWPAQQWAASGAPSIEIETMSLETNTATNTASQSDLKRDMTSTAFSPAPAPAPIPPTGRDNGTARRLLLDTGSQRSSGPSSPLSSLPELGRPPTIAENTVGDAGEATPPPQVTPRPGRGRSFSDATRHFQPEETVTSSSRSLRSPSEVDLSHGQRPPLGSRSNSSNSAIFGMVRNVFTKNRPRSNSTLRYGSSTDDSDFVTNEFGARDSFLPRPESSASSLGPSPALPPVRIRPEDVPQVSTLALQFGDDDRRVVLAETPERSPRSSYAASLSSRTTLSTRRSHTADPHGPNAYGQGILPSHSGVPGLRVSRARAQTVSSGALSWHGTAGSTTVSHGHGPLQRASHDNSLAPPSAFGGSSTYLPAPTTPTFPTAATPPRQRPGSIRRLSTGLFRSNPSSPKPPSGQLFPLPPRGPGAGSSGGPSPANEEGPSRSASPLPLSRSATPVQRLSVDTIDTSVHDNDTPESWLARLANVDRRELAGILAASADDFHTAALTLYMNRFDFTHIALDVALRRFLMHMSLPKETQQIDRVIEAFATRYDRCEPGLFGTKDNAYVLGFSMMMLHTDAFNKHNKNKMTKADYVRNTRLDGVPPPVLEAFYDNITFTPFVFIEDDNEAALAAAGVPAHHTTGSTRSGKIDVYDLIVGGQLGSLRVDVERVIPADSPFSCMGTRPFLDVDRLQRSFANAHPLQFVNSRPRRKSSVPLAQLGGSANVPSTPKEELTTLKITKVGLISRKDDTPTTKRTGARKWRSWSVILTGSQLLFFKDTIWALTLVEQIRTASKASPDQQPVVPRVNSFQPDEVLSVKGSVAVFDRDYSASPYTFRFVMSDGRQFLMQLNDEYEMNEWLTLINYASTFKTAAIRMRAAGLNSGDAVKAGSVAAEEHRRAVESGSGYQQPESSQVRSVLFADSDAPEGSASPVAATTPRPRLRRVGSLRSSPAPIVDITGANDVVVNGGEQMEAVIGSVKAELAAGRAGTSRRLTMPSELAAAAAETPTKTIRSEAIQQRVQALKSEAANIERRLTTNLRIARNLAILTPFQKSTRDHIEQALPDLANQIRSDRVELSKLHLWITMLLKDQDRDQRDWARVRHVALQAAARSLCGPVTDKAERRATIAAPIAIPKLSLPDPDDDMEQRWSDHGGAFASGQASPGELPVTNPMSDDEHDHDPKRTTTPSFTPTFVTVPEQTDDAARHSVPSPTSPTSPTSARSTSDSDDYELAPEYLGSTDSLREEMERQLAFSATTHSISSLAANGPVVSNTAPVPTTSGGLQVPVRDELRDDVQAGHDQPEHWRNTRAASKVSLAHLPRSSLGELSRKFIKIDGNDIVLNAD